MIPSFLAIELFIRGPAKSSVEVCNTDQFSGVDSIGVGTTKIVKKMKLVCK